MADKNMVTVDADELLGLLDHVNGLVKWCAANMPDHARYYRGARAMWAVAHRLAGNDRVAGDLIGQINDGI